MLRIPFTISVRHFSSLCLLAAVSLSAAQIVAAQVAAERSENGAADSFEIFHEVTAADATLLEKFVETARAKRTPIDTAGLQAADRQVKEQIAAKHHITVPQLEEIVHAMEMKLEQPRATTTQRTDWYGILCLMGFLLANIPVFLVIGRIVFGGWDGFWDSLSACYWWRS